MKSKGFTLIELLAVIILLSVIALVVYPKVKDTLDESRQKAFIDSAQGLYDTVDQDYVKEGLFGNATYEYDGKQLVKTVDNGIALDDPKMVEIEGKIEEGSGTINVDSKGHIVVAIQNDEYCAYNTLNNKELNLIEGKCPDNIIAWTDDSCFTFDSTTGTIIDYNQSCGSDVVIPYSIDGVKVEILGNSSFKNNQLTSVAIPIDVTTIGEETFQINQITDLDLSGLTDLQFIGKYAFDQNMIAGEIDLSNSGKLTLLTEGVFARNSIESVKLPSSLVTLGELNENYGPFDSNSTIKTVNFSDLINLKQIGMYAFYDSLLTEADLSNSIRLEIIGEYAFDGNQLTSVTIPNSVTSIGEYAFEENQLESVTIGNGVTSISKKAFFNNQLASLIIPNSVTSIGEYAFEENQLESVIIPESVTSIGDWAFEENQLTSVIIPESVTSISDGVFSSNNLTSVIIPDSVTSVGYSAFYNNQLASVTIPNSVTSVGDSAFENNQLTSVIIPESVTSIEGYSFSSNQLTSVTIPNSVISIGCGAFNDNLLPDDQAYIYARNSDGSINNTMVVSYGGINKEIILPSNIITIGSYAFTNNQLTSVTIPNSVTSIGTYAFSSNKLISVTIPNSVTSIGSNAFRYNYILQGNATIDNTSGSVSIGSYVFYNNGPSSSTTITPVYLR